MSNGVGCRVKIHIINRIETVTKGSCFAGASLLLILFICI